MNNTVKAVDTAPVSTPAKEIPAAAPATPHNAEETKVAESAAAPAVKI